MEFTWRAAHRDHHLQLQADYSPKAEQRLLLTASQCPKSGWSVMYERGERDGQHTFTNPSLAPETSTNPFASDEWVTTDESTIPS